MENSQLLEYIGKTKTKNLVDDIQKEYCELQIKTFQDRENFVKSSSLISVTDFNETEIKSIGMSCINDLFLNNWGRFLAFILGAQAGNVNLKGTTNIGSDVTVCNTTNNKFNSYVTPNFVTGTTLRLGLGATPPAMNNFNVETGLTSGAPEASTAICGDSSYSAGLGKITIPTVIAPTTGAGTIRESVLFGKWLRRQTPANITTWALIRDSISPNVVYVANQTIGIEYSIFI